ncbi:transporter [Fulvimonas sp. R45]|uniref:transporter n=1 Tax=Fulvimonas sp. R45 TaxID=3045937 RepID=UPI00265F5FED|nr:transporter [Fulvimonas sp. R45]MDO1527911.1 transporter [Fulvimonas sp. R45]
MLAAWLGMAAAVSAQDAGAPRQALDDAWWTGPMLANSAETLPRGHVLVEPYVYDVASKGTDAFGSRAYVLYGLTDRLTVGLIPIIGYTRVSNEPDSAGIGLGDQILQAQYRLTRFHEGGWLPTLALQLQETLPTGRHDRLSRASDGMGGGAWATTLGLNAQSYFWMPNGRLLRARLNLTRTFNGHAGVTGASVYGTGPGFRGTARPGDAFYLGASLEYSLTRRWVLALDVFRSHGGATRVDGRTDPPGALPEPVRTRLGGSDAYGYAPAVEYSWTPNLGVLFGLRVVAGGHGTRHSLTPAIAVNLVH